MQQRYNELYDSVNDMTFNELRKETNYYKDRNMAVSRIVEITEDIHFLQFMKNKVKQIENSIIAGDYQIPLIIAYYFKKYNIFKVSDYIDKKFVQDSIDGNGDEQRQKKISLKFKKWLESVVLRKYMHDVYAIVHYILYSKLWYFDDEEDKKFLNDAKERLKKICPDVT